MLSIKPAPGQDLHAYADQLLIRFADPALRHRLDQIAMDGSQKINAALARYRDQLRPHGKAL